MGSWRDLFETFSVAAGGGDAQYKDLFGVAPQVMLVRPDGYAAFVGGEHSLGALGKHMQRWFSLSSNKSKVSHA